MKKPVKKKAMGGMVPPQPAQMMPQGIAGVPPMRMKKGGKVGRGDGACMKGRTKGKMV
jgi:hypothetical protein